MKFRVLDSLSLLGILVLGVLLFVLGASIPVHFRSVDGKVIQLAGEGTATIENEVEYHLNAGRVGPAKVLSGQNGVPLRSFQSVRVDSLLAQNPVLHYSGGPAPYFEQFIRDAGVELSDHDEGFFYIILPSFRRKVLGDYLAESSNSIVRSLLDLRAVSGWQTFPPVFSAGGAPLETSILVTALYMQGEDLSASLTREVYLLSERAIAEDGAALARLEAFFLAVQSLGKKTDFTTTKLVLQQFNSVAEFASFIELYRADPRKLPWLVSLSVMADKPALAAPFLGAHGEKGEATLTRAMAQGEGAVNYVLEQGDPLYEPSVLARVLLPLTDHSLSKPFARLTFEQPMIAHILRGALLLGGGLLIMWGLLRVPQVLTKKKVAFAHGLLPRVGFILSGLLFGAIFWLLLEPNLLLFGQEKTQTEFNLVFNVAEKLNLTETQNLNSPMLDQVAIITLLIFFFLQLLVYIYCLMKLADIRRQDALPAVKIHLVENEENLFDLGLYVGLGGTVLSLVMLQMDLINVSLVAAYSSSLFGILFVSVLKIFHVRPYLRELILAHAK